MVFMKNGINPNPNKVFPVNGFKNITYVKPTLNNPNIIVGDFTYFSDTFFERHVSHNQNFFGDKLIIGKFCQIGKGVNFVMNGANHQMNTVSTFPFYILEGWNHKTPDVSEFPNKGDTVVGNDVWIGENVTILPGVKIGDGAIIGMNSVVGSNVPPYTIVAGNPAKVIRKRFDDELIQLMIEWQWWNFSVDEIDSFIPVLTSSDLNAVKNFIKKQLNK